MKSSLYHIFTVVAAASLLAGASCTSVDMGGSQDQPDRVQVSLGVNWPEDMGQDQRPEQLYLVMSRIINTVHYVWQIGPDGNIINIYPPLEPDPDPGEDTDVDAKSGENLLPEILNGDYYIMAFNNVTDSYRIDSLAAFLEDEAISMRDLTAVAAKMTDEEVDGAFGQDRPDFNPSFSYIKSGGPIYIDVRKQTFFPDAEKSITLDMRPLTQELTFRLKVSKDEEIEIASLTGEISGVPGKVELMSGKVEDDPTYRVVFNFVEAGTEGEYLMYEGTVNVLGLFYGESKNHITGRGILQISVKAKCGEYERVFHAGINMLSAIQSAGLMEMLDDASGYRTARSEAGLDVGAILRIDREQVVPGEDGQGIEIWLEKETIDVEI